MEASRPRSLTTDNLTRASTLLRLLNSRALAQKGTLAFPNLKRASSSSKTRSPETLKDRAVLPSTRISEFRIVKARLKPSGPINERLAREMSMPKTLPLGLILVIRSCTTVRTWPSITVSRCRSMDRFRPETEICNNSKRPSKAAERSYLMVRREMDRSST